MSPPILASSVFVGICFAESVRALFRAHLSPLQQGTSMCIRVMFLMLFWVRISVSFVA